MKKLAYEGLKSLSKEHWWFRGRYEIVKELMELYVDGGKNILDIGSGYGGMIPLLKNFGEVTAVEPYEESAKFLRQYEVKVYSKDIFEFFKDNRKGYDLITMFDVLEHIEKDEELVKIISRAMESNGKLVITVPAFKFLWSSHDDFHEHKRRYRKKELKGILLKNDFKVIFCSYYNFFLFIPILIIRSFEKLLKIKSMDLKKTNKILNFLLEKIFSSERFFLKHGVKFPFGVSIICIAEK